MDDLSLITAAMERLRANPPVSLLYAPVSYRDLAESSAGLPPTDAVELASDEVRVVVRRRPDAEAEVLPGGGAASGEVPVWDGGQAGRGDPPDDSARTGAVRARPRLTNRHAPGCPRQALP